MFFRIASTFPYTDLLFCLSFFCTESWAMVPTSFAIGTRPGTLVVVSLFFFLFFAKC